VGRDRLVEEARLGEVADADPEVVDPVLALARFVVMDGFEAVPVRVAHEGAVVGRRVLRARPGLAVVGMACGSHCAPPAVDGLARGCNQRDVQVPRCRPLLTRGRDREILPLEEVRPPVGLAEPSSERASS